MNYYIEFSKLKAKTRELLQRNMFLAEKAEKKFSLSESNCA